MVKVRNVTQHQTVRKKDRAIVATISIILIIVCLVVAAFDVFGPTKHDKPKDIYWDFQIRGWNGTVDTGVFTDEETGVVYEIEEDANKPGSGHYTARILYDPATDTNSQASSADK